MKVKRIVAFICIIMIISSLFSISAFASVTDTNFRIPFGIGGTENLDTYSSRAKENDTSTYIWYKDGPKAITVKVYGTYTHGVISRNGNWYPGIYNCMGYFTAPSVNVGRRGFIRQWVYENGYPYAVLSGHGISQISECTGVWSPDSVPESGVSTLN